MITESKAVDQPDRFSHPSPAVRCGWCGAFRTEEDRKKFENGVPESTVVCETCERLHFP